MWYGVIHCALEAKSVNQWRRSNHCCQCCLSSGGPPTQAGTSMFVMTMRISTCRYTCKIKTYWDIGLWHLSLKWVGHLWSKLVGKLWESDLSVLALSSPSLLRREPGARLEWSLPFCSRPWVSQFKGTKTRGHDRNYSPLKTSVFLSISPLVTFLRKTVNFRHIIIHVTSIGCSHFNNICLVIS